MSEHQDDELMLDHLLTERQKENFAELFDIAVDRWLDKKFAQFGKWAIYGMFAAIFVYLLKLAVAAGVFK